MKKIIMCGVSILVLIGIIGCGIVQNDNTVSLDNKISKEITESEDRQMAEYTSIPMSEAMTIFENPGDYIIVDVRRADEFAGGHIPGAINIANESIVDTEPAELPDKEQTIYVYCRSGNRSKQASAKLAKMGYTHIIEFGGIIDWTGEVEK